MVFKKLIFSMSSSIFLGLKSWRWRIKVPASLFELIKAPDPEEGPPELDHDDDQAFDEGEKCCVCLSRLKEGEDTRHLPCLHEFHRECIDRWLISRRRSCPLCRFCLEDGERSDDEKRGGGVLTQEMITWFSSFHVAGF